MIASHDRERLRTGLGDRWEALRGRRVFVTGGTGFVGCWLLEAFAEANRAFGLGAELVALTRDPERFRARAPHLAGDPAIVLHAGDARTFAFPSGPFAFAIHAATETPFPPTLAQPLGVLAEDLAATQRVLAFSAGAGVERLLFTSSGAAYGPQPPAMTHMPEEYPGGPFTTDPGTGYGHGKRLSEFAIAAHAGLSGIAAPIARLFAFVGPYLPLDANFAVGNFIADALAGRALRISGDGTPRRSYLYGADLAVWLWTLLFAGQSGRIYNVGSPADLSIREVAEAVTVAIGSQLPIDVAGIPVPGRPPQRYVSDTSRAEAELGLTATVDLLEGIRRTIAWHRARK